MKNALLTAVAALALSAGVASADSLAFGGGFSGASGSIANGASASTSPFGGIANGNSATTGSILAGNQSTATGTASGSLILFGVTDTSTFEGQNLTEVGGNANTISNGSGFFGSGAGAGNFSGNGIGGGVFGGFASWN